MNNRTIKRTYEAILQKSTNRYDLKGNENYIKYAYYKRKNILNNILVVINSFDTMWDLQ